MLKIKNKVIIFSLIIGFLGVLLFLFILVVQVSMGFREDFAVREIVESYDTGIGLIKRGGLEFADVIAKILSVATLIFLALMIKNAKLIGSKTREE